MLLISRRRVNLKKSCRVVFGVSIVLVIIQCYTSLNIDFETSNPNAYGVCMGRRWSAGSKPIYVITPTYPRGEQIPELVRLAQTLMHIDSLVWIVAEDSDQPSERVQDYLRQTGLCHVYLHSPMPPQYRTKTHNIPSGVANRNAGLMWTRAHAVLGGVLYFADDDNTYDIRLFEEIRKTKRISMFPVGLVTQLGLSSPIVREGSIVGFYDGAIKGRKFPVDMAGFAVGIEFLASKPLTMMPFTFGEEEEGFLSQLNITYSDIELLADNCTKVLVWHTKTLKSQPARIPYSIDTAGTNIEILKQSLWRKRLNP